MKRLFLFSMVVLLCAPYSGAQLWKMKRYEATAGLGTSQFYGDVGGYTIGENILGLKDITFKQTRFSVNGSFRYFVYDNIAARISFSYVMLHATDERGSNEGEAMKLSLPCLNRLLSANIILSGTVSVTASFSRLTGEGQETG